MATVYTGAPQVTANDFRYVKWVGRTKGGKAAQIVMKKAFCRSNIDWKFEDKNDTTAELEFEGAYSDTDLAKDTPVNEPWELSIDGVTEGPDEILLGVGKFYIGKTEQDAKAVALTRGGGSFVVEREYREISADGDPGLVEGRIVKEAGRPKLKLVALQWLSKVSDLYPCVTTTAASTT